MKDVVMYSAVSSAVQHVMAECLESTGIFMAELAKTVINECKDGYPELGRKERFYLKSTCTGRREVCNKTIDQGLAILEDMEEEMIASGSESTYPATMHSSFMILMDSQWI